MYELDRLKETMPPPSAPSRARTVNAVRRIIDRSQTRLHDEDSTAAVFLSNELSRLHDVLAKDYAHIEKSSLYHEIPERHPRFSRTLETLRAKHALVLRELRDVLDELWWADWADTPVGMLTRVQRLLTQIERIDRHENEILQKSVNQDLPAID